MSDGQGWDAQMVSGLVNLAVSALSGAATAFLAVRLSLSQFRSEKWWEKKFDAYVRVYEYLGARRALGLRAIALFDGAKDNNDRTARVSADLQKARAELRHIRAMGELILSPETNELLRELEQTVSSLRDRDEVTQRDRVQAAIAAIDGCLDTLKVTAKADLDV